jgi:radical SAM protein with 4Fe4S-binding SPASM domain
MQNLHSLLRENRALGDKVWLIVHVKGEKPYEDILSSSEYQRIADLYGKSICHIDDEYDNWTGIITKNDLPRGHGFKQLRNMSEPCSELYNGLIIHANGDIGICARKDLEGTLTIGNLYQDSLESVWKGKALRSMRENWRKGNIPTICKTCYSYLPLSNSLSLVRMKLFGKERVKLV